MKDLTEENEQLYRNEERNRRLNDELQTTKTQITKRDREIDELDVKLRQTIEDRVSLETTNE